MFIRGEQEERDKFEAVMQRRRERVAAEKKAENAKYTFKVSQDRVNKERRIRSVAMSLMPVN
jgi:hypothetical protein